MADVKDTSSWELAEELEMLINERLKMMTLDQLLTAWKSSTAGRSIDRDIMLAVKKAYKDDPLRLRTTARYFTHEVLDLIETLDGKPGHEKYLQGKPKLVEKIKRNSKRKLILCRHIAKHYMPPDVQEWNADLGFEFFALCQLVSEVKYAIHTDLREYKDDIRQRADNGDYTFEGLNIGHVVKYLSKVYDA